MVFYQVGGGSRRVEKNPLFWGLKRVKNGLKWLKNSQKHVKIKFFCKKDQTGGQRGVWEKTVLFTGFLFCNLP